MRDAFAALRRRWLLIAACTLLAAAGAWAISLTQTKKYSASASLLFRDPGFVQSVFGGSVYQTVDPTREADTNLSLASLGVVAERTARKLNQGLTGGSVEEAVSVEPQGGSNLASVTATETDPELAARLANEYARQYVVFRRGADRRKIAEAIRLVEQDYESLTPEEQAGDEGQSLQEQISQLSTLQALQTGNAEVVQRAEAPSSPSSPRTSLNVAFGGFFGLLLGLALALVLERLDRRLRKPDELGDSFSLPLLAGIPESKAVRAYPDADGELPVVEGEAFRMLRTRIRYFNVDRQLRSVVVTSPSPQDGKTTVAWNFARSSAEAGVKTILVEADFHRPTVAARADLWPTPGLSELLSGQAQHASERRAEGDTRKPGAGDRDSGSSVIQRVPVETRANGRSMENHLDVIVAGTTPPNPLQILESDRMARLIRQLSEKYDLVLIDTPPAALVADSIPLIKLVDGVIVVGQISKTTHDEAVHLRDQLRELDAPVLGVVANRVKVKRGYYGYYGSDGNNASRTRLLPFRGRTSSNA